NVAWMHVLAAQTLRDRPASLSGQAYYCTDASPDRSHMDFNMELLGPAGVQLVGQGGPVLPLALTHCLVWLLQLLRWVLSPFLTFAPFLNRYTLAMASTTFTVRTQKAWHHFGYRPLYTWEEARDRTVRWLRSLPKAASGGPRGPGPN
ncbi:3 beta-hydroxysteroid dehydrogenase type 7-like, partial [Chiloscyllium punctatum]|uniref:3 beta-hydroxysteroid dehydrogenase type 7-like n=1 Tax=Chiloscyllium punctatum TaxID=137246 RepID=UPI003B638F01